MTWWHLIYVSGAGMFAVITFVVWPHTEWRIKQWWRLRQRRKVAERIRPGVKDFLEKNGYRYGAFVVDQPPLWPIPDHVGGMQAFEGKPDVYPNERPAFQITANGHHYRIWANGITDGFGSGRITVINRIPLLEVLAAQNALKQRDRTSKPE